MSKKYFGTDGIRGEFGAEPLTENFFVLLGAAISKSLLRSKDCKKRILFGCDTRESSNKIINLISSGLSSEHCVLSNAGIVSTPAIAFYTRKNKYDLGIVVSASHNLYHDNGIKIFNKNGFKISLEDENYIENYIEKLFSENYQCDKTEYNLIDVSKDIKKEYIESCLNTISLDKNINNSIKLTLDLANGANYIIGKEVFIEAGYKVNCCNDKPSGKNINAKCGSTYLKDLPEQIKLDNSKYGISMDGDGDRIVIIDKHNNILDGDDILYTIVRGKIINNEKVSGLVGTTMTNIALENYLKNNGIDFVRSNVGDKYVLSEMRKFNYDLGGETSGHILMLNHSTSGDSIIAALQFLFYSDILDKNKVNTILEKYPQKITNIFFKQDLPDNIIDIVIKEASDRFSDNELRLIIRKSGTENCIRIMVEAKNIDIVDEKSMDIKEYIENRLQTLLWRKLLLQIGKIMEVKNL